MSRKNAGDQLKADLRAVLALPEGRRYLFDLLERFGVLRDIWSPSAEIHRKAGMQAAGFEILGDIRTVSPELVSWRLSAGLNTEINDDEDQTDV